MGSLFDLPLNRPALVRRSLSFDAETSDWPLGWHRHQVWVRRHMSVRLVPPVRALALWGAPAQSRLGKMSVWHVGSVLVVVGA